jgi:chromosome partitioning protein
MAFVVTVALLKGGVGKTTTAVALAEAASHGGRVTLIDADPMGSAYRWSMLAAAADRPLRSTVVARSETSLARSIGPEALGADVVVIDSPPPGALRYAESAIEAADFVVMPCPPQKADLDRVDATVKMAREHGKPCSVVLTMVRAGLAERDATVATLDAWGVPVFTTELPLTVAVERNYGQPVTGPLARFGFDLMTEILRARKGTRHG